MKNATKIKKQWNQLREKQNRKHKLWNKCDECGRIIPYKDLESGAAIHQMITPDSDVSSECFETLCKDHYKKEIV